MGNTNPKSFTHLHQVTDYLTKKTKVLYGKSKCNALQYTPVKTINKNTCEEIIHWEYLPNDYIPNDTLLPNNIWNIVNSYTKPECLCFDNIKQFILQMDYYRIQETQVFQVQPQIEIIYSSKRNVYIIVYGFDNINKKMACVMLMILISEDYISSAYHKNIDDLYDMYPILPHTFYGEYQGILMNRLCFSTRYRSLHSTSFDIIPENYKHVLHEARNI